MEGKLTVFFDDSFWVGIFERWNEAGYSAARVVFGSEPLDAELYAFVLENYASLQFTTAVTYELPTDKPKNFKRMLRENKRSTLESGVASKAHEVLQQESEKNKQVRQEETKEKQATEAAEQYRLRQERKKEKRRRH